MSERSAEYVCGTCGGAIPPLPVVCSSDPRIYCATPPISTPGEGPR